MKKIGFLIIALVLALGTLGVGYAAWTDEVIITGSVDTGSLDLVVEDYSGMWFWKVPGGTPEYFFTVDPEFVPAQVTGHPAPFIVAYAASKQTLDSSSEPVDDSITMTFSELFPIDSPCVPLYGPDGDDEDSDPDLVACQYAWRADFVLHYNGTIPAMVDAEFTSATGDAEMLWNLGYAWVVFEYLDETYEPGDNPWVHRTGEEITDAVQMHYCDYVLGWLCVVIPQVPPEGYTQEDFMNLVGTFTAKITAIQWNEYVP